MKEDARPTVDLKSASRELVITLFALSVLMETGKIESTPDGQHVYRDSLDAYKRGGKK